jgi:hypothetical protein
MRSAHRLALMAILALYPAAHADTIFNFSATFNGIMGRGGYPASSQATGTLTIDTVQGVVTGASIQTVVTSFFYVNGGGQPNGDYSPHSQVDLNAGEVDDIADAVSPATGLPVRVVIRSKLLNGAVEEVSGMPSASKTGTLMGIGAAVAALPWAAGIFVGWLSPSPAIVIAVGLVLWFCVVLTLYLAGRTGSPRKNFPALRTLTTLVTFSAAYGVCFVVTAYLRGRL